jgi:hypothetical protein
MTISWSYHLQASPAHLQVVADHCLEVLQGLQGLDGGLAARAAMTICFEPPAPPNPWHNSHIDSVEYK